MEPSYAKHTPAPEQEAWRRLKLKLEQAGASLQALASQESADELRETLHVERRLGEHPYGIPLLALAAGFLLGGGLLSPAVRRSLGAASMVVLRLAVLSVFRDGLASPATEPSQPKPHEGAAT